MSLPSRRRLELFGHLVPLLVQALSGGAGSLSSLGYGRFHCGRKVKTRLEYSPGSQCPDRGFGEAMEMVRPLAAALGR